MKKLIPIILTFLFVSCSYEAKIDDYTLPEKISVEEIDGLFRVMPQCFDMDEAMVFYPGGLVDPKAYIPLAAEMASTLKMVVFIQKMPLDLAILGRNRVEAILKKYSYIKDWYFAGHSLGGVMAASWIYNNPGIFNGLILLGSYPMKNKSLADSSIAVLSIRGSEDGLTSAKDFFDSRSYLPANAELVEITGGNHAQFGSYGIQKKDGEASIPKEKQREKTISYINSFLDKVNPQRVY